MSKDAKIISKYYSHLKKNKIDVTKSAFCYFSGSISTLGYYNFLKIKKKIGNLKLFFEYIKNIYGVFNQGNYKILNSNNLRKNFDKLIVTWAFKQSFDNKGNLFDRYLQINSKNLKKTIWFVIYLDKQNPKKISSNIILLKKDEIFLLFKIIYFIKTFFRIARISSFNLRKIAHYFTSDFNFSNIVMEKLRLLVNFKKIKEIKMPYESQIFQNEIFKFAKKKNFKVKNLAFVVYTAPFPKELYFNKNNKIDKLYLVNSNMREILAKHLRWPFQILKLTLY